MRIEKQSAVPYMDKNNTPAARCQSGDTLIFQTKDCFGENVTDASILVHTVPDSEHNLATGPVYVEGAEPGDVLKVEIQKIDLAEYGCQALIPGEGPLGDHIHEEYSRIYRVRGGYVEFNDKIKLPISPMIGVIGTAPAGDPVVNVTPGEHGSNMDNRKIQENTTLYLPVNVPGGLLAMGDIHAVMGDGESSTCGLEISGEITVRVTVIKDPVFPTPFLVTEDEFITISSALTLDEAAQSACEKMHSFLGTATDITEEDRNVLLSLAGNMEICQVVNPLKTARMTVPAWIVDKYGFRMP